jgi:hypothetical protein
MIDITQIDFERTIAKLDKRIKCLEKKLKDLIKWQSTNPKVAYREYE